MPSPFTTPIEDRTFEDYVEGSVHAFGSIAVTESAIVRFATRYDPQSFHVDPAAARESAFGGVIASGWHTASMMMRMVADHYLPRAASLAGKRALRRASEAAP